jgi:UDP-N-acetylmuramoyl-tripeptide--D-alanyl-D-alanine ligase
MALNAAAAVAVGEAVGVPLADMVERLALGRSMDHRMEMRRTSTGTLLIDDCYNANPTSMQAALETLKEIPGTRHVALVGVMAELEDPRLSHREIRDFAVQRGIELIAVDTDLYGIDGVDIERAIDVALELTHEDVLLVKGSRVAALERAVVALTE